VSYSLRFGTKAGIISTLGINVGSIVAILISAFGLSALLNSFPAAIQIIEFLGGIYVIYLATLICPRKSAKTADEPLLIEANYRTLFKNGIITSLLNPKDILFYTAFIPTFIPTSVNETTYLNYFVALGFAYMSIGFITKSIFSIFAGFSKKALCSGNSSLVNYFSSTLLFSLGVYLVGKSANLIPK
jgi:threonine/homoserine/homoserine lactone efflux protein